MLCSYLQISIFLASCHFRIFILSIHCFQRRRCCLAKPLSLTLGDYLQIWQISTYSLFVFIYLSFSLLSCPYRCWEFFRRLRPIASCFQCQFLSLNHLLASLTCNLGRHSSFKQRYLTRMIQIPNPYRLGHLVLTK